MSELMEEGRREKIDLVWASVFQSLVATVAMTLLCAFSPGNNIDMATAIDLMVGWTISILCVVMLLANPGSSKALLSAGRLLVWLVFASLAIAGILGMNSISRYM